MSVQRASRIIIHESADGVAQAGVAALLELAEKSGAGFRSVALSGGSTPKRLYELLANVSDAQKDLIRDLHYFFGDERSVPNDHKDSNVKLAHDGFLQALEVAANHVHPVNGGAADLIAEAARLTAELQALLPKNNVGVPVFDLVYLGMGTDGHTASLFPGTKALRSATLGFVANDVPQLDTKRITLTYPVLNAARKVCILATGANKATVLKEIFTRQQGEPLVYPIEYLSGSNIEWHLDKDAAKELPKELVED